MASPSDILNGVAPMDTESPGVAASATAPMDTSPAITPEVTPDTSPKLAIVVAEPQTQPPSARPPSSETGTEAITQAKERKRKASSSKSKAPATKRRVSSRLQAKGAASKTVVIEGPVEISEESLEVSSEEGSDENFKLRKEAFSSSSEDTEDFFEEGFNDQSKSKKPVKRKKTLGEYVMLSRGVTRGATKSKVTPMPSLSKSPSLNPVSPQNSDSSSDVREVVNSGFPHPTYTPEFLEVENMLFYASHAKIGILEEKNIDIEDLKSHGIFQFLESRKFLVPNTNIDSYVESVVRNFYANLSSDINNRNSPRFGKCFVRGRVYEFNPKSINRALGLPNIDDESMCLNKDVVANFLTKGKVTKWPSKSSEKLPASRVSSLYSALHKLCLTNWLPTKNEQSVTFEQAKVLYKLGNRQRINFGRLVFDHIATWPKKTNIKFFPFPSLTFKVLLDQSIPIDVNDGFSKGPSFYTVSSQLLEKDRPRIIDLPWSILDDTSGSGSVQETGGTRNPNLVAGSVMATNVAGGSVIPSVSNTAGNTATFIPTTVVLGFLNNLSSAIQKVATGWVEIHDMTQNFIDSISPQKGGDGVGAVGATAGAADGAAEGVTTDGESVAAASEVPGPSTTGGL